MSKLHIRSTLLPVLMLLLLSISLPNISAQEQLSDGWLRFTLTGRTSKPDWTASSVLESDQLYRDSRYGPEKALDGDPATAWVEGVPGPGLGESYVIGLPHYPEAMGFINGYAKNRGLFEKNYRVKELRVQVFAGLSVSAFATEIAQFFDARPISDSQTIKLADIMEAQRTELPFDRSRILARMREFRNSEEVRSWDFPQAAEMGADGSEGLSVSFRYLIRLEIADTYPGSKWEDTCIAELWPDYGRASKASVSQDDKSLVITDGAGEQIPTYSDFEYVLTLVETSRNKEWAIVIKEPAYADEGRISSTYAVIHTPTGRDMSQRIFGPSAEKLGAGLLPTGFTREQGTTYLEYEDFEQGETKQTPLSLY
ncbi:MAG: hypothetical protein U5P10_12290 [Spirochaetia bacterium]|nr:hypothetical protein [Spirochaetia bacterium]